MKDEKIQRIELPQVFLDPELGIGEIVIVLRMSLERCPCPRIFEVVTPDRFGYFREQIEEGWQRLKCLGAESVEDYVVLVGAKDKDYEYAEEE